MDVMIERSHERSWIGKLMGRVRVFVPLSLEAVQTIKEIDIVHVKFVRADANNGS